MLLSVALCACPARSLAHGAGGENHEATVWSLVMESNDLVTSCLCYPDGCVLHMITSSYVRRSVAPGPGFLQVLSLDDRVMLSGQQMLNELSRSNEAMVFFKLSWALRACKLAQRACLVQRCWEGWLGALNTQMTNFSFDIQSGRIHLAWRPISEQRRQRGANPLQPQVTPPGTGSWAWRKHAQTTPFIPDH